MGITTNQALEEYPKLKTEVRTLQIWKNDATIVLMCWDEVFELLPEEYKTLGKSKSECVKEYIIATEL